MKRILLSLSLSIALNVCFTLITLILAAQKANADFSNLTNRYQPLYTVQGKVADAKQESLYKAQGFPCILISQIYDV